MIPDALLRALDTLPTRDSEALAAALDCALDVDALLEHAELDPDTYTRVLLHSTGAYEIRLLCWNPGQSSALHAHGSACAMRVLHGTATEVRLDGPDRELPAGTTAPSSAVHQIANRTDGPVVSLHVYAPPLPVDRPSMQRGWPVVIVGGGLAGVAVAIHLLELGPADLRITLVEKRPAIGPTLDGADGPLEVRAERLSIDPDHPDAFVRYARSRGIEPLAGAVLPPELFGRYVADRLHQAISFGIGKLRIVRDAAIEIDPDPHGWRVRFGAHRPLDARHVVLATGGADVRERIDPLWRTALERGVVVADELGLGILTAPDHSVMARDRVHASLWAVGGPERPRLFDAPSIAEIARDALEVATSIVDHAWAEPDLRIATRADAREAIDLAFW